MIDPASLEQSDIGRQVTYHPQQEQGELTSWNSTFVFVRFLGPGGEACCPEDVSFTDEQQESS